eukprot:sb/3467401/
MFSARCQTPVFDFSDRNAKDITQPGMPFGKTARIQQADRQFAKHLNQIKKVSENELTREHRCIEEVFRLEMLQHQLEHQAALGLLEKIHHVSHHRDALLKRSFETILERFSFSSVYDSSEMSLPPITGLPTHKLLPKTAPGGLGRIAEEHGGGGRGGRKKKASSTGSSKWGSVVDGARGASGGPWNRIKITLPRCENETPVTGFGGLSSNEVRTWVVYQKIYIPSYRENGLQLGYIDTWCDPQVSMSPSPRPRPFWACPGDHESTRWPRLRMEGFMFPPTWLPNRYHGLATGESLVSV